MGFFKRAAAVSAQEPVDVMRWRGRASELVDAGHESWQVVMEALKTEPLNLDELMGELGLVHEEVRAASISGNFDSGRIDRLYGQRHGCPVEIRLGVRDSRPVFKRGAQVTWVRVNAPSFTFTADKAGALRTDGAPPAATAVFDAMTPAPEVWPSVDGGAGPEGIVLSRPITMHGNSQGWLFDLWLAERLAAATNAPALVDVDTRRQAVPYRKG